MKMKKLLVTITFTLSVIIGFAQTWDAGGDATSWNDPLNWDNDAVPAAGDLVTFSMDATVTGTAPNAPQRVMVDNGDVVTLDLDLNIGDGVFNNHGIKVQANGILNLGVTGGTPRTFNINVPTNKNGILHNANGNPATVNIAEGSTVNITQGLDGIIMDGTGNNVIVNEGTLNISGTDDDGIDMATGIFTNKGILNISALNNTGNMNHSIVTGSGSTFTNEGSVTASGGSNARAILTEGTFDNKVCATLDVLNKRVRVNAGTFTNDGLYKSGWAGAGIFMSGPGNAVNNAFFSYPNTGGGAFAGGSMGTIMDNGIKIEDAAATTLDAGATCTLADIGIDAVYDFYLEPTQTTTVGQSTGAGALSFSNDVFGASGSQTIYTCFGNEFSFTINNVDGTCVVAGPPPPVPTLSQWGLIILGLLMMILMTLQVSFANELVPSAATGNSRNIKMNFSKLPFEPKVFLSSTTLVLVTIAIVFTIATFGFGYEMTNSDPWGSIVSSCLIGYILMLLKLEKK